MISSSDLKSSSCTEETRQEYLPDRSVLKCLKYNALCFVNAPELAKYPTFMCFRKAGATY